MPARKASSAFRPEIIRTSHKRLVRWPRTLALRQAGVRAPHYSAVCATSEADDERCPVADDEEGIPVPRNDEAYTLNGAVLTVDASGGSYDVALDQPVDEIWGVDGGVVAFIDETDTVQLYR